MKLNLKEQTMKTAYLTPVVIAIVALLGACSSTPKSTDLLEQTRADYRAAQSNPKVASYAAPELRQAGETLGQANAAANDRESDQKIDKLAYLARQKIALTQEVAIQKSAEAEVANAGRERDQIRLNQRTLEADQANAKAEQAKRMALGAQLDAAASQRQTEIARGDAAQAQRDTQDAQRVTQEAQRVAQEAKDRAAKFESQLAELAAKKTERGMVIVFGDVLFGVDLARLNTEGLNTAQKLATVLIQNPARTVLVEGFADSTGTDAHNQELSERRAAAVQTALKTFGVPSERIAIRGYGESHPVVANDTAANRQLNRRVEIVMSDEGGKIKSR